MDDKTTENPTPTVDPAAPLEAPSGTLAMALAVIDADFAEWERTYAGCTMPQEHAQMAAAWVTVRAAAIKSLEPPPAEVKKRETPATRAQTLAATALSAITELGANPSPDAHAAIQVQAALAQVGMSSLLIECLHKITFALERIEGAQVGMSASIECANQFGWGGR